MQTILLNGGKKMAKNYDDEDEIDDGFVDDYVEDEDNEINVDKETNDIEDEAPDIDWDQGAMDEPAPDIPEDYSEFPDPMPFNEDDDYDEDDEESFKDPEDTGFEEMLVEKKKAPAKRPAPRQEAPVQKPAPRKPQVQPTRPHPQPAAVAAAPAASTKPAQTQNIAGNYARIEGDIVLNCNLACNASLEIVGCTIVGDLSAKELHINGTVKGNVVGASVNIGKDAVIEGNIKAKSIHIEKGAQIIGDMSMG